MTGAHLPLLVALVIAYLAGSIPSAYLAGKLHGVDLTKHGSGNLGATNVVRVLGAPTGIAVFIVDVAKGLLPVILLPQHVATSHPMLVALALGVVAILGHVRSAFLGWRAGGKGVATATGVFFGLAWLPTLIAFGVWVLVFTTSGYVSLASLMGALALPAALAFTGASFTDPVFIASIVIALFVFYTHRANIGRLRRGEEHRFRRGGKDGSSHAAPPVAPQGPR
jgi:glycerol-3-phosphate acyltransferase PlsY